MKRIFCIILLGAILIASFSGCVKTNKSENSKPSSNMLSVEQVEEIAYNHWNIEPKSTDPDTGFPYSISVTLDFEVYHVYLKWLVDNDHYSTVDSMDVAAYSGEVLTD